MKNRANHPDKYITDENGNIILSGRAKAGTSG